MKVTECDNNYAVSTQQLSEGLAKSASTARTFGITMEENIGHITGISSVTMESGRIIGNSLKTIYSRITTSGGAIEALEEVGVKVKQIGENGEENVRPVGDILDDLAGKWWDLSDAERQNIGVKAAGRYQLSRFLGLMNNYQYAMRATETAINSEGSAMRENQEYLKSYEARINRLKVAFTEFAQSMGNAILDSSIVLIVEGLTKLAGAAQKAVDTFGFLPIAFAGLGAIGTKFGIFDKWSAKIVGLAERAGLFGEEAKILVKEGEKAKKALEQAGDGADKASSSMSGVAVSTNEMGESAKKAKDNVKGAADSVDDLDKKSSNANKNISGTAVSTGDLDKESRKAKDSMKGTADEIDKTGQNAKNTTRQVGFLGGAFRGILGGLGVGVALGAIGWLVEMIMSAATEAKRTQEELDNLNDKMVTTFRNNGATQGMSELLESYDELNRKTNLTAEEQSELNRITQIFAEGIPTTIRYIDANGEAHMKTTEEIAKHIEHVEALSKAEADLTKANFGEAMREHYESMSETFEKLQEEYQYLEEKENIELPAIEMGDLADATINDIRNMTEAHRDYAKSAEESTMDIIMLEADMTNHLQNQIRTIQDYVVAVVEASGNMDNLGESHIESMEKVVSQNEALLRSSVDNEAEWKRSSEQLTNLALQFGETWNEAVENVAANMGDDPFALETAREQMSQLAEILPDVFHKMVDEQGNLKKSSEEAINELKGFINVGHEIQQGGSDWERYLSVFENAGYTTAEAQEYVYNLASEYDNAELKALQFAEGIEEVNEELHETLELLSADLSFDKFGFTQSDVSDILSMFTVLNEEVRIHGDEVGKQTENYQKYADNIVDYLGISYNEFEKNQKEIEGFFRVMDEIDIARVGVFDEELGRQANMSDEFKRVADESTEGLNDLTQESINFAKSVYEGDYDEDSWYGNFLHKTELGQEVAEKMKEETENAKDSAKEMYQVFEEMPQMSSNLYSAIDLYNSGMDTVRENIIKNAARAKLAMGDTQAAYEILIGAFGEEFNVAIAEVVGVNLSELDIEMDTSSEKFDNFKEKLEEQPAINLGTDEVNDQAMYINTRLGGIISEQEDVQKSFHNTSDSYVDAASVMGSFSMMIDPSQVLSSTDEMQQGFQDTGTEMDNLGTKGGNFSTLFKGFFENISLALTTAGLLGAITAINDKFDELNEKARNTLDSILNMGRAERGFIILKNSIDDTMDAADSLKTSIGDVVKLASEIPTSAFDGITTGSQQASTNVSTLIQTVMILNSHLGVVSTLGLGFSASLSNVSNSAIISSNMLRGYISTLSLTSTTTTIATLLTDRLIATQRNYQSAMGDTIRVAQVYNTVITTANVNITASYVRMAAAIIIQTNRIMNEYNKHGIAAMRLDRIADDAWKNIIRTVGSRGGLLIRTIQSISDGMKNEFKEGMDSIVAIAEQLPTRIGSGVRRHMQNASSSMDAVAKDMVKRFKSELGIHSPSRVFEDLGGWVIKGLANGLTGSDLKSLGKDVFSDFGGGVFDSMDMIKAYVSGDWGNITGSIGGGAKRWTNVAAQALIMTNQMSKANLDRLLMQMNSESGGNPGAINLWDCLTLDAKILTKRGWLRHDEVIEGDETIAYNFETGKNEWTRIIGIVHYEDAEVATLGNSRWSARGTLNHRWITQSRKQVNAVDYNDQCPLCDFPNNGVRRRGKTANNGVEVHLSIVHNIKTEKKNIYTDPVFKKTYELNSRDRIILSAPADTGKGLPITNEEASILGWVAGDGHVETRKHKPTWSIEQTKKAMVIKIRKLLILGKVTHKEYIYENKYDNACEPTSSQFRLDYDWVKDLESRVGHPKENAVQIVLGMSDEQRKHWLEAMIDAEGTVQDEKSVIYQTGGEVLDAIELAIYLSGRRPKINNNKINHDKWADSYSITGNIPHAYYSNMNLKDYDTEAVWCVTTELGSWTANQNGHTFLTGNSNAKRGIPSKGLMQVIDPTFSAYKMPGFNNIWNPLDNILASIRYTLARYGSLTRGWRGVGYEEGGFIDNEHLAMVGEGNKREVMIPLEQHKNRAVGLWKQAGEELGLLDKHKRARSSLATLIGNTFSAFSGESGISSEGSGNAGTSGIIQPSVYTGGTNYDGNFDFVAFNKDRAELTKINKYERQANVHESNISIIEQRMRVMVEGTLRYRNALKQVVTEEQRLQKVQRKDLNQAKNRQKSIERQLNALKNTSKHSSKQRDKYNELQREYDSNLSKINSLEKTLIESAQKIKESTTEIFTDYIDNIVGNYNKAIGKITSKIDGIEFKLSILEYVEPDNITKETNLMVNKVKELNNHYSYLNGLQKDLNKELTKANKKYGSSSAESKKIREELDGVKKSMNDITLEVLRTEKSIKDIRASVADDSIKMLKDYYRQAKDLLVDAVEREKKLLEENHESKMKKYDAEIEKVNSVYDAKFKAMDKEKEEANYQAQIDEKNAKKKELIDKINLLSMDNSLEARKKMSSTEAELVELEKELAEMKSERQDQLVREQLEEQKKMQVEALEEKKEAEDLDLEEKINRLDQEKEKIETHYNDIIENERYWAEIRDEFIEGNFSRLTKEVGKMKNVLKDLDKGVFDSLNKGFLTISDTVRKEVLSLNRILIDNLNFEADAVVKKLNNLNKAVKSANSNISVNTGSKKATSTKTVSKPKKTTTSSKSSSSSSKSSSKSKSPSKTPKALKVGGKAKVNVKNANAFMDSYGQQVKPWTQQAKAAGVKYGQSLYVVNMRGNYAALGKKNNVNSAIAWIRKRDLLGLETGGMTPDWAGNDGKLAMLHKKELVLDKGQTEDILDVAKLFDRMRNFIPKIANLKFNDDHITSSTANSSTEFGDINIYLQGGDRRTAEDLSDELIKKIKKKGGL